MYVYEHIHAIVGLAGCICVSAKVIIGTACIDVGVDVITTRKRVNIASGPEKSCACSDWTLAGFRLKEPFSMVRDDCGKWISRVRCQETAGHKRKGLLEWRGFKEGKKSWRWIMRERKGHKSEI